MQRVLGGDVDETHAGVALPCAAVGNLESPVVVGVAVAVAVEGGYLLLVRHGRGEAGVAVQVAASEDMFEADRVSGPDQLTGARPVGLAVGGLDAPEVVVVGAGEARDLLLPR